jgi:hypothetical protein
MRRLPWLLILATLVLAAVPVRAEEIFLLGGEALQLGTDDDTYAWQIEYLEGLGEHVAATFSYLNEGHLPGHHRDGLTTQLWLRDAILGRRLSLAAGIGPYYYFDTDDAKSNGSFSNEHGWGGMLSLAATWYTDTPLLLQLRTNLVLGAGNMKTLSAVAGIGCQLESPPTPGPLPRPTPRLESLFRNEVTLFSGRTIVNSFSSEHSLAAAVEYRRRVLPYLDATGGWLYEGDNRLLRRDGLTAQVWGVHDFFHDRLALGVGAGAYFAIDHYSDTNFSKGKSRALSAIATFTGSVRLSPRWQVRTSWNRIVTNYNRDTDVILAGIGYRF